MKAEELMVGDWVMWKNRQVQIARVSGIVYSFGHIDVTLAHCNDDNLLEMHDIKSVSPIPLTPEILEKNGFSGEGYNMGVIGFHTDPIPEVKDGYEVFIWKDMCLEIKHGFTHLKRYTFYVHELQHALRLCGINLEIKL